MWNIYTRDYYSAVKRNDIMPFTAIWMDPEIITLGQTAKDKYHDITYMWNLKRKMIQMNLFIKHKQTHRHGKQTWLSNGKELGEVN